MNSDPKLESVFVGNKTHKNFWENKKNSYYRLTDWMKVYSSRQVRQPVFREDTGIRVSQSQICGEK